jgi:predicted transcriptional regulator
MSKKALEVGIEQLAAKLDQVTALLRIIAKKDIDQLKRSILSTRNKEQIFELCNGSMEMGEIAKKVDISGEYVRLTVKELEEAGFILVKKSGTKRYPVRVI